jgi:hypothetical protein
MLKKSRDSRWLHQLQKNLFILRRSLHFKDLVKGYEDPKRQSFKTFWKHYHAPRGLSRAARRALAKATWKAAVKG